MPNLAKQIREALAMFARTGTEPALIGGLAVVFSRSLETILISTLSPNG
jgi:hypothetical protein